MLKKKITQCIIILILTIFIFLGMSFKVSKMTPYVNLININIIILIISSNIFLLFINFNNRILKGLVDLISFSAISYLSLCIIFEFIHFITSKFHNLKTTLPIMSLLETNPKLLESKDNSGLSPRTKYFSIGIRLLIN